MDAARLGDDGLERLADLAGGLGLEPLVGVAEQVLGLAADDRQGVVDLVPGPGGELGQRLQLALTQPPALAVALLLQRTVQAVQLALQRVHERRVAQPPVLGAERQQVAQQGRLTRVLPAGRGGDGREGLVLHLAQRQAQRGGVLSGETAVGQPGVVSRLSGEMGGEACDAEQGRLGAEGACLLQRQRQVAGHRRDPTRQLPAPREAPREGHGPRVVVPVAVLGKGARLPRNTPSEPPQRGEQPTTPGPFRDRQPGAFGELLCEGGDSQRGPVDGAGVVPLPIDESTGRLVQQAQGFFQRGGVFEEGGGERAAGVGLAVAQQQEEGARVGADFGPGGRGRRPGQGGERGGAGRQPAQRGRLGCRPGVRRTLPFGRFLHGIGSFRRTVGKRWGRGARPPLT